MKLFLILALVTITYATVAMDHAKHGHHGKTNSQKASEGRKSLDSRLKGSLIELLKSNEALHEAFFGYDSKVLAQRAKALAGKISRIEDKKLKKVFKRSVKILLKIKASEDKEKNYHYYWLVNKSLVEVLKTYDLGSTYNVYYCPMLKKHWVQNSTKKNKVHNPYAGDYMPHCGFKESNY